MYIVKIITTIMLLLSTLLQFVPVGVKNPLKWTVENMPLRNKVTQMLMVDFRYWDENTSDKIERKGLTVMNSQVEGIIRDYNFGAVIYFAQNLTDTKQSYELTMRMQKAATEGGGIPMLISADQEGGSVYRLGTGTALPGNMALGATGNTAYAKTAGQIIGSELSVLGINTNLAPVVDVNNNANNPVIGLRSYGDDPVMIGNMASATISGMKEYGVIGCAKHFPGHGDTATDSHYGLPTVNKSLSTLQSCELKPYEVAIKQGIEMIMTAHILYPQLEKNKIVSQKTGKAESLPATMSDDIITGLLKNKMGFKGIVVTDAMNMAGITANWKPVEAVVNSINAGVDMICMPCELSDLGDLKNLDAIINGVTDAVNKGKIPMSRINDAVERILKVKTDNGIMTWKAENYSLDKALNTVGCKANREKERQIAAAAVTVVQNKNNTLPLKIKSSTKVLMLVPYDNEKAQMVMGWNRAKDAGIVPDKAQVEVVRFNSSSILNTYKSKINSADIIIINSEITKASKMNGKSWESSYVLTVVDYAESQGKVTVVQSVDKPYDVQSYPKADAVIAVYGCKGSSVDPTEALVGGVTESKNAYGPNIVAGVEVALGVFGASGKLPVNIPEYKSGSYTSKNVYSRGHGITYKAVK